MVRFIIRHVNYTCIRHKTVQPAAPKEMIKNGHMADPKMFLAMSEINLKSVSRLAEVEILQCVINSSCVDCVS